MMKYYLLFVLQLYHAAGTSVLKLSCDSNSGVTNMNSGILPDSTGLSSKFASLDTACYGNMKSTLLLLQEAVKEGEKCDNEATRLLGKLETMCTYLKPLNGFAAKFDRVIKLLKLVHKNLDKVTKFADNIPRIGQLRKIIVEKVIPMALDVLEKLNTQVKKVVDYERILLKYEKQAKLIWRIDKYGSKVCKVSSPLSLSLSMLHKVVKEVNQGSRIVLQTTNKAQDCITRYCNRNGGAKLCSSCSIADQNFAAIKPKVTTWKTEMTSCYTKLSKVNELASKMNVVSRILQLGEAMIDKVEKFLKPINDKIHSLTKSVGKILNNMMSCCPCGRPNTIGCSISAATKVINLITCPLDGLTNKFITDFTNNIKQSILNLVGIHLPIINAQITLPTSNFAIDIPNFLQQCLKQTSYGKGFVKICGISNQPLKLTVSVSFKATKSTTHSQTSSLSNHIATSCKSAINALKKLGNNLKNCFDRIDDLFFAIPIVGIFAAMTCDPNYKDPDPGINYCPCKSSQDALVNKDAKQPYCVVWHKSWMKSCTRTCQDKKYSPGKNPSGKTSLMHTTKGYPYCDKLKYYCRQANVVVKNGRISCKNEYTYLGGSCAVVPNRGYICPLTRIHCGYISKGKTVCWNYRFIECAKDNGKHFPMCTCRNKGASEFKRGDIVCQSGDDTSSETATGVKAVQKSFSCFLPLGRYKKIKDDCGPDMFPCVIEEPKISSYQRCTMSKFEKFWDAHGKKFVIAGAIILVIGVIGTIVSIVSGVIPGAIAMIILAIIGIVLLVCGLVIKSPEGIQNNYIRMGTG